MTWLKKRNCVALSCFFSLQSAMDVPREAEIVGTWSSSCLQVFPEPSHRPALFDPLGLYCIPHVGVYGEDYTPCGPIAVLALPTNK